jgi:hypothetical protein
MLKRSLSRNAVLHTPALCHTLSATAWLCWARRASQMTSLVGSQEALRMGTAGDGTGLSLMSGSSGTYIQTI